MKFAVPLTMLTLWCATAPGQTPNTGPNPTAKVATHYFYWYLWPNQHFKAGRKDLEGHFHHFVAPKKVSYTDPEWHRGEFERMAQCGIDFALPVYWGPNLEFSRLGLPPMTEALTQLEKDKLPGVKIGLFFDTTLLLPEIRGGKGRIDLRSDAGKAEFCRTITGFFAQFPQRFWARVDGRTLVVLYTSNFVGAWNPSLGAAIRRAFAARFPNENVFLVADASWGEIGQDRQTLFGAALGGPQIFPGVAEIGPGFDDSQVPGRKTPSRDRENGNFYRWSWRRAVASRPELVIIETWNEMHEGSEICESKELGRTYLDITREWIGRLRSGDLGPEIEIRAREPKPFRDHSWGHESKGAKRVYVDYTKLEPERSGLRETALDDGRFHIARRSLRPVGPIRGETHVSFDVSDFFRFDVDQHLQIIVDAEPIGGLPIGLDYDSRDSGGHTGGRYTSVTGKLRRGSGEARRIVFDLPRARFANRQREATDFRLRVRDVRTAIRRIEVRIVRR
jgi:hypothetical protein